MSAFDLGSRVGANLLTLEHRYYGASQPFEDWSYENLKWLNTTQALADIALFIDNKNSEFGGDHQWVVIGGSYPGALSAWFKSVYPNHAVAAWSSSGVINAIQDFTDFDFDIFNTTQQSGVECSQAIAEITESIDAALDSGDTKKLFKDFANTNVDIVHGDFMFFIADIFTMGVQYGTRTDLCNLITSASFKEDPWANLGIYADIKGVKVADYDA